MQRLFTTAGWDAGGVRDDVRGYVAAALGDPDGVLIGNDTGFEKGGCRSAGVQRQYTGTAGKITNCQLGVFLAYASPKGTGTSGPGALPAPVLDRGRAAAGRRRGSGGNWVPDETAAPATDDRGAATAGIPFGWVTADEAYGDNGPLRACLEERGIAYVLAVARAHVLTAPAGRHRADALAAKLPRRAWQRLSCGDGAKGERRYDWALVASSRPEISLLIRRSVSRPSELAFYLCHTPRPVPLSRLVKIAGAQWAVEKCFQAAKNETGDGPLPGQALRKLVPLHHPRHARPRFPRRHPGCPRRRQHRPDQLGQRDPPHVHSALRTPTRRGARPPLVTMAPPPPRTRPLCVGRA